MEREIGVSWVGYDHRGWVEREIGSRGIEGFEKINNNNNKYIHKTKSKSKI